MNYIVTRTTTILIGLLWLTSMVWAQENDTTLHLGLSLDTTLFKENLIRLHKKDPQAVDTFWINGSSITVTCKKSPDVIEKVIGAVRASAVEHVVIEKPVIEKPIQPVIEQPKAKEKYDPVIDVYLNIEDESIFSDAEFISLDEKQIHPRSYKYYCLIRDINEFGKILKKTQGIDFQKLMEEGKQMVDEMSVLAEQISGDNYVLERSFLTQKQKDYYNNMRKEYVKMWEFFYKKND